MELWSIYGSKSDCDSADPNEVERITCMIIKRREKQAEDDEKQRKELDQQKKEAERNNRR